MSFFPYAPFDAYAPFDPACRCYGHCRCCHGKTGIMRRPYYGKKSINEQEFFNDQILDDNTAVEHNDKFKIVVILDESGSMESLRDDMLKALNDLIKEQKQINERPATFTLVKFNNKISRVKENEPLETSTLLEKSDYVPTGSTALYDAIGCTINRFRFEKDVLMVIITDGQENASRKYSKDYVADRIEQKKKDNWSFVYLSCDLSTARQGEDVGIVRSSNCSNIVSDVYSYGNYLSNNLNSAISNFRTRGISIQEQLNKQ